MASALPGHYPAAMRIPATNVPAITNHLLEKGWAVAADVLTDSAVADLRALVVARCATDEPGASRLDGAAIEHGSALLDLLRNQRFMAVMRACIGTDDVVVHRSAAILRMSGSPQVGWHSDFDFSTQPPTTPNERLNRGEWPNGAWFYLNGSHPERGGLAVVEGSHLPDWQPPATWDRQSGWELPGVVELLSEPQDLVLFSARTWHAARPYTAAEPRLSTALALRPAAVDIPLTTATPPATVEFLRSLPPDLAPFFTGYAGWIAG